MVTISRKRRQRVPSILSRPRGRTQTHTQTHRIPLWQRWRRKTQTLACAPTRSCRPTIIILIFLINIVYTVLIASLLSTTTTQKPTIAFSGSNPPRPPIPIDPSYSVIKRRPDGPPHIGVLVDTARSYFSISNLKTIVSFLAKIGLNLLHIRLTDDQSFMMNFTSHPELAAPTAGGVVYSAQEMKDLVRYASDLGIAIMPELNVPGHAAGWFGIPGLVPDCPKFACQQAYGVPLMSDYHRLIPLLRDLISELREVFYTSPLIHLGGDEIELGDKCFVEAGHMNMTSAARNGSMPFERRLSHLLTEMDVPPERVVRWEYTGLRSETKDPSEDPRNDAYGNATIKQYWHFSPRDDWSGVPREPYFVSTHFYIDTFDDTHDGFHMYEDACRLGFDKQYPPLGVITGTFELDWQGWTERNVYGKLLAFAMGLADGIVVGNHTNTTRTEFDADYDRICPLVRPTNTSVEHWTSLCSKRGSPLVSKQLWYRRHTQNWAAWRKHVCQRMKGGKSGDVVQTSRRNAGLSSNRKKAALPASSL